jgi:hypothetical protein
VYGVNERASIDSSSTLPQLRLLFAKDSLTEQHRLSLGGLDKAFALLNVVLAGQLHCTAVGEVMLLSEQVACCQQAAQQQQQRQQHGG